MSISLLILHCATHWCKAEEGEYATTTQRLHGSFAIIFIMCMLFVHEGCWLAMCERWWLHRDRLSTPSYEEVPLSNLRHVTSWQSQEGCTSRASPLVWKKHSFWLFWGWWLTLWKIRQIIVLCGSLEQPVTKIVYYMCNIEIRIMSISLLILHCATHWCKAEEGEYATTTQRLHGSFAIIFIMCMLFVHEGCWLAMCERWWLHRDRLSTPSYEEVPLSNLRHVTSWQSQEGCTSRASPLVWKKHSFWLFWGWWLLEIYTAAHTDTTFSHLVIFTFLVNANMDQTTDACLLKMCSKTVGECTAEVTLCRKLSPMHYTIHLKSAEEEACKK